MKRRDVLTLGLGASAAGVLTGRAWATTQRAGRFLLIFLRGGCDAANVLAPTSSDFYYEARPTIHLDRPAAGGNASYAIDADWSLHPALAQGLQPLWAARQLSFIPFAGTGDMSRSHFETQDSIERSAPLTSAAASGFMSRLAEQLSGVHPISLTDQLPLIMRGGTLVPNVDLHARGMGIHGQNADLIQGMYANTALAATVREGFAVREETFATLGQEMVAAGRGAGSAEGFEATAAEVARMMSGDFDLGFLDIGGWDTHVRQGAASGYLATQLGALGRGLATLSTAMGPAWRDTTVMVISEFGRTFRENGDLGTDHGHGSCYLVLGGAVKGGVVAGRQVRVSRDTLNQDRDLPVLNEYRAVLSGMFARLYGLNARQLAYVFPDAGLVDLRLV